MADGNPAASTSQKREYKIIGNRFLLIIPVSLLIISLGYVSLMVLNQNMLLDVDLKGGTQILFSVPEQPDIKSMDETLSKWGAHARSARGISGWSVFIDAPEKTNPDEILSGLKQAGWETFDASVQTVGPALGSSFFRQAQIALVIAFIFMGFAVFITFRKLAPSMFVILSAFANITESFALSQFLGIPLSLATFAALLLLIGYSVDTNILLTTRVLKGEGNARELARKATGTGLTMLGTTAAALIALLAMTGSSVIAQIASVLLIGMVFDVFNTWITNVGLLVMWKEKKGATL